MHEKTMEVIGCLDCPFMRRWEHMDGSGDADCGRLERSVGDYEALRLERGFVHRDCPMKDEAVLVRLSTESMRNAHGVVGGDL